LHYLMKSRYPEHVAGLVFEFGDYGYTPVNQYLQHLQAYSSKFIPDSSARRRESIERAQLAGARAAALNHTARRIFSTV
ncbi:hypothetical protein, partial [Duganella sp. SG902]|uniref:hypothetical protein n=1 Tax=Duganella sp. SG902 TaxID=2587016 RepID=UPI001C404E9F